MVMTAGVPSLFWMQDVYWAFVASALGAAVFGNFFNQILYRQRMAARRNSPSPAKPTTLTFKIQATIAAIVREFSNYSLPVTIGKKRFYLPTMGPITIMLGYVILIVVASLYKFNTKNWVQWEDIGYRSGFIAISQLPLITLLSGKRNLIGLFAGVGHERLNWLHRWVSRALFLTVLIHMGFWLSDWAKFDYILIKITTDSITRKGLAAGSILAWIVLSSFAPIRGLSYQFFVVQHIISWVGFMVALHMHVPAENLQWIWVAVGFWAFDRVVRAAYLAYNNFGLLHKSGNGVLACRASFEPLDQHHVRISIANPPITWKAGQHIFLACHPLAPLTSHPFTVASLPQDGKMEFIVQAKGGATKRFVRYAEKNSSLPNSMPRKSDRAVLIDGPYSRIRPLRQFDSVVLVAGSTGATFTVPLMRDIVEQWKGTDSCQTSRFRLEPAPGAVTRHIKFIWCLKRSTSVSWFGRELDKVAKDVETLRNQGYDIAVDMTVYVTCDEEMTSARSSNDNEKLKSGIEVIGERPTSRKGDEKPSVTENEKKMSVLISSGASSIDGTANGCCCTRVVEEDATVAPCCCGTAPSQRSSTSISNSFKKPSKRCVDAKIQVMSGRPNIAGIVRKEAELALGEMAVVVCGPPGMVQTTRNAVVSISDERAVHKGTGAQGIYVHAECFGYA
ncbi:metalloreductase [Calycina marina]|uniref:ferric-chelate reductase (NADPH) n=1 Tax=Calycina marina TaxID=1763456 RepID=A0A9P7Z9N5_9HELO|nr:metalloreductase [Calycina marina]